MSTKTPKELAEEYEKFGMRCTCDFNNWEPEKSTGHSWVCEIHKRAMREYSNNKNTQQNQ